LFEAVKLNVELFLKLMSRAAAALRSGVSVVSLASSPV
jgi:hypothetical protein